MPLYAPTRQGVVNKFVMKNTDLPITHPMIVS
jgi:hypothetical protein